MLKGISELVGQLLTKSGVDTMVTGVEHRFATDFFQSGALIDGLRLMTAVGQVETIRGLMVTVIGQHLLQHPEDAIAAAESLTVIKARLSRLVADLLARLPPTSEPEVCALRRLGAQRAAVAAMIEFVEAAPEMEMTVAEIDETIVSLIERPKADWGPFAQTVQLLTNRAVFEMMKLRQRSVARKRNEIVDLPSRIVADGAILSALRDFRVSYEVATDLLEAIRAGKIPQLSIVD
jgi:hypothetical protein